MSNKSKYRILPEFRLIISSYSGQISENEIIQLKESIKADKDFHMEYNVLDDFSDADFTITNDSFGRILDWLGQNFAWERKSAVLTSTPAQVVNILRFDSLNNQKLPMSIKIFSTLKAAVQWVGLSKEHEPEIEKVLRELKS